MVTESYIPESRLLADLGLEVVPVPVGGYRFRRTTDRDALALLALVEEERGRLQAEWDACRTPRVVA